MGRGRPQRQRRRRSQRIISNAGATAMTRGVPEAVVRFIASHIGSLEELHVLITCIRGRERWWDAATIASELAMTETAALRALEEIARHNLLDVRISGEVRYQFSPGSHDVEEAALALADVYLAQPLAVTQHVARVARRDIRDFADAFRIRRDDNR
jgi:hypothetical protein